MDASYGVPFRAVSCRYITPRAVPSRQLAHAAAVQIAAASIFGSFPVGGKTAGSH